MSRTAAPVLRLCPWLDGFVWAGHVADFQSSTSRPGTSFARFRDMSSATRLLLILQVALAAAAPAHATDRSAKKVFQSACVGRSVVVKRVLYSVVFDERRRGLPLVTSRNRVTGLTVVTPTGASYYQFDARRDSERDIVDQEPDGVVSKMRDQYFRSMHLDTGAAQDIAPLMLVRYSPGVALTVQKVQVDRDRVRLYLSEEGQAGLATTLTVKFPMPLSNELFESPLIDDAISQFVTAQ